MNMDLNDSLNNYNFFLPNELIATMALPDRGASRLLVLRKEDVSPKHDFFANIKNYLHPGDVLVVNNTKVMKARILAFKPSGGRVEVLFVRPLAFGLWAALLKGRGPFLPGTKLHLASCDDKRILEIVKKSDHEKGIYEVFSSVDLQAFIEESGELPLPPYFRRRAESQDYESYQTVYAKVLGAVAAPTAGLHFTQELLCSLKSEGIKIVETTLHVGPGTFLPIRTDNIAHHKMHGEFFSFSKEAALVLNEARKKNHRIIPVGTTSMRVIEQVMQWAHLERKDEFFPCQGNTNIFIRPGYIFLACNALITNFHLPRSTLLLLVSAVAGRARILQAYQEAIEHRYRFFSYGDACYLEICQ